MASDEKRDRESVQPQTLERVAPQNVASPARGDPKSSTASAAQAPANAPHTLDDVLRRKGVEEAWNTLAEMHRQGVTTDKLTVSRMLMKTVGDSRTHLNPSRVYRCIAIVERFIELQPNAVDDVLFNALLDTCCRLKDINRLEATIQKMRSLNVTPSPVTLGILVKTYGQAGDPQKVLQVWGAMEKQRAQANVVTFGCMIDACVKCGLLDKAMEIFEGMKDEGKHRNTVLYTTLIKGFGLARDLEKAMALFNEMELEGVPYNTITFNSMIDACIKCGDVASAEKLLRKLTVPGYPLKPDLITFSTLLKGYCNTGELDKALQVTEAIKHRGLRCDELVYNTLMDGCVKANDPAAGIGLFQEMLRSGTRPSPITHSILARLYQAAGYDQDMTETIAQLYIHHGLERPSAKAFGRARKSAMASNNSATASPAGGMVRGAGALAFGHGSPAGSMQGSHASSSKGASSSSCAPWRTDAFMSPAAWNGWADTTSPLGYGCGQSIAEHSATSTPLSSPHIGTMSPTMDGLHHFGLVPPMPDHNSYSMYNCSMQAGGCPSPSSFEQFGFGGMSTSSPVFSTSHSPNFATTSSPVHSTTPVYTMGGCPSSPVWPSASSCSSSVFEGSVDTCSTVPSTVLPDSEGAKPKASSSHFSSIKQEKYWDALESMCGIGSGHSPCTSAAGTGNGVAWQGGAR